MTKLHDLYEQRGQSPWLDNLRRDWLTGGRLAELVDQGIRGVTSNPTIFAKAIEGEDDYDEQFALAGAGHTVEDAYWELVDHRHRRAPWRCCDPSTRRAAGTDGFVSFEVAPALAHDTDGHDRPPPAPCTSASTGPTCWSRSRPPPRACRPSGQLIGEGRSINVTLIFGLDRYDEVMEAYLSGLEAYAGGRGHRPVQRAQRGVVLREPGRHRGGPPAGDAGRRRRRRRRSWPCGARRRWPRPRWPTSTS